MIYIGVIVLGLIGLGIMLFAPKSPVNPGALKDNHNTEHYYNIDK